MTTRVYSLEELERLANAANGRTCGICFMIPPTKELRRSGAWYLCASSAGLYLSIPARCARGHTELVNITIGRESLSPLGAVKVVKRSGKIPGPRRPLKEIR